MASLQLSERTTKCLSGSLSSDLYVWLWESVILCMFVLNPLHFAWPSYQTEAFGTVTMNVLLTTNLKSMTWLFRWAENWIFYQPHQCSILGISPITIEQVYYGSIDWAINPDYFIPIVIFIVIEKIIITLVSCDRPKCHLSRPYAWWRLKSLNGLK